MLAPSHREGVGDAEIALRRLLYLVWDYRAHTSVTALGAVMPLVLAGLTKPTTGGQFALVMVAWLVPTWALLRFTPLGRWYRVWTRRVARQRRLNRAVSAARPVGLGDRRIRRVRIRRTSSGWSAAGRLPTGMSAKELADVADRICAGLRAREVLVTPDSADAGIVRIVVRTEEAFREIVDVAALGDQPWDPDERTAAIGVDVDGSPSRLSLGHRSVLVGGEPGSGKSTLLQVLVALLMPGPDVLFLLDGKGVELRPWERLARRFADSDMPSAIAVLEAVVAEMEGRYRQMAGIGMRQWPLMSPGVVLVIDELARFVMSPDTAASKRFAALLQDILARGRAAGVQVIASVQRPSTDVVPGFIRDLFGIRIAFRCTTPQGSDTILGAGQAAAGYSASTIDAAARGVGYLLQEGATPTLFRAPNVTDTDLDDMVACADLRRWWSPTRRGNQDR